MSTQKVEMTVEQKENGQYIEQVAYPFVEYDHVAMENGMDIMSMIRDDVSMPMVTHNTANWKVGQGDSDVSESIVDSSVASMAIKGQTYQNILPSPTLRNSMTDGKTVQKINEGYDSVEVVDGNVKSAILKGNTLVNIFPKLQNDNYIKDGSNDAIVEENVFKVYHSTTANYSVKLRRETLSSKLKPNTDYTLIINIIESTITKTEAKLGISTHANLSCIDGTNYSGLNRIDLGNTIGLFKEKVRLKDGLHPTRTSDIYFCFWDGTGNDTEYVKFKVMLLEGDYTNVDIPYFEGMQSVKMPVLTATGKNLFDGETERGFIDFDTGNNSNAWNDLRSVGYTEVIGGNKINIYVTNSGWTSPRIFEYDKAKNFIKSTGEYSVVLDNATKFVRFNIGGNTDVDGKSQVMLYYGEANSSTTYEPYKSNILTTPQDLVLRKVGDVEDTLDLITGEYVQRICVKKFNELEWTKYTYAESKREGYSQFIAEIPLMPTNTKVIFDVLPTIETITDDTKTTGLLFEAKWNLTRFRVSVSNDLLTTIDENGLLELLNDSDYLITVETPAIKTVDLTILDQDNQPVAQLNSFANGYIQVSSQEGTLIPTTEYEVSTSNSYHADLMKPNTQYTMKNMQGTFTIDGIQYNASVNGTFTSPSTLSNRLMITNVVQTQPMLLEGDMTSKEVPYVEGIKSAFEGADKVEIVSQNAANSLSNTTSFQLTNPLRSLPNGVRDEIVLDRVNHKAKIIQRVGEDLTQLATPIVTEVNLEGYPYVYKGGHIFLNTEVAPITEVTYSINQAHQIESSNEDILRHQKEINYLYELIAQYVQAQYEAELIDIALQG